MELLDIYDAKGNQLGYSRSRKEAHEKGLWHKIACIFVVNDDNEIIMQKRSPKKVTNPNGWVCSASGHIDAGEGIEEGALRELKEEIGVRAEKVDLKHIGTVFEDYKSGDINVTHISEIFVIYKNIKIDTLVLQEEEVSDAKYFTLKEIEDSDFAKRHIGIFKILEKEVNSK